MKDGRWEKTKLQPQSDPTQSTKLSSQRGSSGDLSQAHSGSPASAHRALVSMWHWHVLHLTETTGTRVLRDDRGCAPCSAASRLATARNGSTTQSRLFFRSSIESTGIRRVVQASARSESTADIGVLRQPRVARHARKTSLAPIELLLSRPSKHHTI